MTTCTRTRRRLFAGLACAPLLLAGCGGSDSSGPPASFTLLGTFNGSTAGRSGSVSFIVVSTAVSGTLKVVTPAAATAAVTGTYNTSTRAISASAGGYTFTGTYDGTAAASGSFTGPNASVGTFRAQLSTANARSICGTFTSTTGQDSGVFNFSINGTTLSGTATANDGTTGALDGTVSASGAVSVNHPSGGAPLATGTLTGTTASGTFNDRAGNQGTWTGSVCS